MSFVVETANTPPPPAERTPTYDGLASHSGSECEHTAFQESIRSPIRTGVGELTVVKVEPEKHLKNRRKRTQYDRPFQHSN
jgi:hypothetical protein